MALAPRIGAHTPPVLHAAHVGFASAAAIAALLSPDAPARCDALPPRGGWYAGVPEPFPTAAFEGDVVDRSFVLDKEFRPSGTIVTSIADGPRGISYVKVTARHVPPSPPDRRAFHVVTNITFAERICTRVARRHIRRSSRAS